MKYSDAFPDEEVPLVQLEQVDSKFPKLNKMEYIQVLQNEIDVLSSKYYKPKTEGTGHFNTAISVLKFRIEELKKEL